MRKVPRPKNPTPHTQVTMLLPDALLERVDALVSEENERGDIQVTRADILRRLVRRGLESSKTKR